MDADKSRAFSISLRLASCRGCSCSSLVMAVLYQPQDDVIASKHAFSTLAITVEIGLQITSSELENVLTEAGFRNFEVVPSFGYYSLVTATKR